MIKAITNYFRGLFSSNENIKKRKKKVYLTEDERLEVIELLKTDTKQCDIALMFDVSSATISNIKKRIL